MEFYDVEGTGDIRELWDSMGYYPEQGLNQDFLMSTKEEECGNVLYLQDGVVLRDRLMTDAALGGPRPIKSEHSYSLLASSAPPSPATPGANPHMPNSTSSTEVIDSTTANVSSTIGFVANLDHKPLNIRNKIDDMEEECFPTISMNVTSDRSESSSSTPTSSSMTTVILKKNDLETIIEGNECPEIKGEPISAPASPCIPCPTSCDMIDDKSTIAMVPPLCLHFAKTQLAHISDSEEDDEEFYQEMEVENYVLCETKETALRTLPPTPPSSASSDSEGTPSASCSPERRDSQTSTHPQNLRGLLTPRLYVTNGSHTTRQPIHTPLISCQPKGSTGVLTLTEEEKRTLIAEGYPVPTKLPLTKQEEKSLKKVRRKIKNKISAQESRRKKKEYMDGLERRVTMLMKENTTYREKLNSLENRNCELLKELQRLQALVQLQQS